MKKTAHLSFVLVQLPLANWTSCPETPPRLYPFQGLASTHHPREGTWALSPCPSDPAKPFDFFKVPPTLCLLPRPGPACLLAHLHTATAPHDSLDASVTWVQRPWHCQAPPLSSAFDLCPLSPHEPSVLSGHLAAPPPASWTRTSEPTAQVWVGGWGVEAHRREGWDEVGHGRAAQEGGDICIHTADSHSCIAETNTTM